MKLAEIENALIDLIKAGLPYLGENVQVATQRNFDSEGNILAIPPAVLLIYAGAQGSHLDPHALTYAAQPRWLVAAGASNLRGALEEKQGDAASGAKGAYDLVDDLRALGGKKLPDRSLVVWRGDELLQHSADGTWYAVTFEVRGHFVNIE